MCFLLVACALALKEDRRWKGHRRTSSWSQTLATSAREDHFRLREGSLLVLHRLLSVESRARLKVDGLTCPPSACRWGLCAV